MRAEAPGQLRCHRGEHLRRLDPARHQGGHPSQRGLLLCEHAQFVLLASAFGHVATSHVEQAVIRYDVPLKPAHGAIAADDAVFKLREPLASF